MPKKAISRKGRTVAKKSTTKTAAKKAAGKKADPATSAPAKKTYSRNVKAPEADAVNPAADAVRELRGKRNLQEFADKCGLKHAPAVARIERKDYFSTTIKTLLQIAVASGKELVVEFK